MFKYGLMLCTFFAVSVSGATKNPDDVKADSVVYDKPTEWKVYAAGGPVIAFAVQKDLLWYATGASVFSTNLKKADVQKFPKLGTISGSGVKAIVADPSGKVWFGGENGVAVKNGPQFTNYTTENGLPNLVVNAMAVANDGSVWVGTDSGAAVFQANQWKVYTSSNGLASDKVTSIIVDNSGTIWIGSNKGITAYNGTSFKIHNMKSGLSWNNVKALASDPKKGIIWAAVGEKDVNCFDGSNWKTYMDIQPELTSIMADTHSRIWFGSSSGLLKFNGEEWITDTKQIGIPATQISQMYRDSNGNLWFGMQNGVLKLTNPYPL